MSASQEYLLLRRIEDLSFQEEVRPGIRTGKAGIYPPGALGAAVAASVETDRFITRAKGKTRNLLPQTLDLEINIGDNGGESFTLPASISHGLVETYQEGNLPEVIFVCPHADKIGDFVEEMVDLTHLLAEDGHLSIDQTGNFQGKENLPAIVVASNGIFDEPLRFSIGEAMRQITQDERIGDQLAASWLERIIRGSAYVRAGRKGNGDEALYRSAKEGVIILTGGADAVRRRVVELADREGAIRFIDGGENVQEHEWRKAYTNLMTNVLVLLTAVDRRIGTLQLDIPVGRILSRIRPVEGGSAYIEVEEASSWCQRLGESFLAIAHTKGLFTEYKDWQEFNRREFLDSVKDLPGFYSHIPSSLQTVRNQIISNQLPDSIPASEAAILDPLIAEAEKANDRRSGDILKEARVRIFENIAAIKEVYRRPERSRPADFVFGREFNQSGDTSYLSIQPAKMGLPEDQVASYAAKAVDVISSPDEVLVPMTAEVFTYGPERIFGNVAFITNGAGFALEGLDRCVEAGVRLGFVSDLRIDFDEGKYYLAIKMALAANPAIDTVALNVLTTLGTSTDVARAVERILADRPNLRFVIKIEGRDQEEGIAIFQRLKGAGRQIIFTSGDESLPASEITPLTLDEMVRSLRQLDGMPVDNTYEILYGERQPKSIREALDNALGQRLYYLLAPNALEPKTWQEIELLQFQEMLYPERVFGQEFRAAQEGKVLTGKPIVVIAGYGETARLQARLMRQAGTEVVLFHPRVKDKVKANQLAQLQSLGINVYPDSMELASALERAYPEGVDVIGVCYEPFKPEVNNEAYSERIEAAVDSLVALKTTYVLNVVSILVPTEMVPTATTKHVLTKCKETGIWFIGPNSPGMSRVFPAEYHAHGDAHLKIAQIPPQCVSPGEVAVAGAGGTMIFETLLGFKKGNQGITWAVSLGGDRTRGLSVRDAALIAEKDPKTKYFVYIGEPGGVAAQELAEVMRAGLITKPVFAKLIGHRLPDNCHIGHSGSVIGGQAYERIEVKEELLRQAGALIVSTTEQMVQVIDYTRDHPGFGQIDKDSPEVISAAAVVYHAEQAVAAARSGLKQSLMRNP